MKHPAIMLGILLLLPLISATGDSSPPKPDHLTIGERVTVLEQFAKQQHDYNHDMDDHMTRHVDDILRSQGAQDEKIIILQQRQAVVYSLGEAIAWSLTVVAGLIGMYVAQRAKEAKSRHTEITTAMKVFDIRFQSVEASLLVLHTQLSDHLKDKS